MPRPVHLRFVIMANPVQAHPNCGVCGEAVEALSGGYHVFTLDVETGGLSVACRECVEQHEPALLGLLGLARAAESYNRSAARS